MWYFLAVVVIGVILSVMIPLGHECDGVMHFYRSYDVSMGNVLDPVVILSHDKEYESIPADFSDYGYYSFSSKEIGVKEYYEQLSAVELGSERELYYDPRTYASVYYYPQALGLLITRALHGSVRTGLILAHLFNMLTYAVITAFAVKLVPVCRHFFAAACMCPLCIYQASSMSSDAMLNALCFLFIALVLRFAMDEDVMYLGAREMLPLGVLLLFIYMNKYIYVVLGLLVFLIPRDKFDSDRAYRRIFALSLLPLLIFVIYQVLSGTLMPAADLSDLDGYAADLLPQAAPEYAGLTGIQFAMKYPGRFLMVLWRTFYEGLSVQFIYYSTFGPLSVYLEPLIYVLPIGMLLILLMDAEGFDEMISKKARALLIIASVLVFLAVVSTIYLLDVTANAPGDKVAGGIQARYFVTLVAMLGMALRPKKLAFSGKYIKEITIGMMTFFGIWASIIYGVQLGR